MKTEIHRKRFDKEAPIWDQHYKNSEIKTLIELEIRNRTYETIRFIESIQKEKPKILDIGCGSGNLLQKIKEAKPKAEITGIDISSEMVKLARKYTPRIYQKDIEKEALKEKFDIITLMGVFPYFDNPIAAAGNIDSMLKKEGYVILTYNNKEATPYKINKFFKRIASTKKGKKIIEIVRKYVFGRKDKLQESTLNLRGYTRREIKGYFKGYKLIKEIDLIHSPGIAGRFSVKLDTMWRKMLSDQNGYATLVVLKKK